MEYWTFRSHDYLFPRLFVPMLY